MTPRYRTVIADATADAFDWVMRAVGSNFRRHVVRRLSLANGTHEPGAPFEDAGSPIPSLPTAPSPQDLLLYHLLLSRGGPRLPQPLHVADSRLVIIVHSATEDARRRKVTETWTVDWVRSLPRGAVLYDIGANIGIFSLLAVEDRPDVRVVAIEPSAMNYNALVQNIRVNGLAERVMPLGIGLGRRTGVFSFNYQNLEPGGSLHSFGTIARVKDDRGTEAVFSHACLCARLDDLVSMQGLPFPSHLKIDVDGAELEILQGAERTLADPRCRGIQIEVMDRDSEMAASVRVERELVALGFERVATHRHRSLRPIVSDHQYRRCD